MPASSSGGGYYDLLADNNPTPSESSQFKKISKRKIADQFHSASFFNKVQHLDDLLAGPKFLTMKRNETDQNLSMKNVSPVYIDKAINLTAGDVKDVRRMKDGTILIETFNQSQADKLCNLTTLYKVYHVTISLHPFLNTSKGVLRAEDFEYMTDAEIVEGLEKYHCLSVRRITRKTKNGDVVNTSTLVATFNLPAVPVKVKFGFLSLNVRPFYPNPLRCFGCQLFGHSSKNCKEPALCGRCSQHKHDPEDCIHPEQCFNCKENHPSWSRSCPTFIQEQDIVKIKVDERVSYFKARSLYKERNPLAELIKNKQLTYASKALNDPTQACSCNSNNTNNRANTTKPQNRKHTGTIPKVPITQISKQIPSLPTSPKKNIITNTDMKETTTNINNPLNNTVTEKHSYNPIILNTYTTNAHSAQFFENYNTLTNTTVESETYYTDESTAIDSSIPTHTSMQVDDNNDDSKDSAG